MNTGQHAVLAGVVFIADFAGLQGEERVVLAHANVHARVDAGAALTNDDVAGNDGLAAEDLYSAALTGTVTTVAGRAACFLMSHDVLLKIPADEHKLGVDALDLERGVILTMALQMTGIVAAPALENKNLLAAGLVDHFSGHGRVGNTGSADFDFAAAQHKNLIKSHFGASFSSELFDENLGAFLNAVLLSTGLDNSVHYKNTSRKREPLASLHMKSQAF